MLPLDDSTQNTGPIERQARHFNRRDSLSERRHNILHQKHTDSLPQITNETLNGRIAWRQLIQLREENKRLRWELTEIGQEIETLHSSHQQELEQYQNHLQDLVAERDSLKETHRQLERRYQELYHDFQSAVEEEAQNMVSEAARTIELTPGDEPIVLKDVMKTVELHVRQIEEKNTAEALYLMRQAQRKAKQMEQELAQERQQIAIERQNLQNIQKSAREQAELRKRIMKEHLQAQYTLTLTLMTSTLLLLLPILQIILLSAVHIKLAGTVYILLFVPIIICAAIAGIFSYVRTSARVITSSTPQKKPVKKQ